jgi:hypothetical protein
MNLLKRAIRSLDHRLNEAPLWAEPPGSEAYRQRHRADYEPFIAAAKAANLAPPTSVDFTGAGATDYLLLTRAIETLRPRTVLELGGGITTYVMARALQRTGGYLVSVDHIAQYSEGARALLTDDLAPLVSFHLSPAIGENFKGTDVIRYRDIPGGSFDLIYVDGPPSMIGTRHFPTVDAMLHYGERTVIIVDGRRATLSFMSRWLDCPVLYDPVLSVGVIDARKSDWRASPKPASVRIGNALEALGLT